MYWGAVKDVFSRGAVINSLYLIIKSSMYMFERAVHHAPRVIKVEILDTLICSSIYQNFATVSHGQMTYQITSKF